MDTGKGGNAACHDQEPSFCTSVNMEELSSHPLSEQPSCLWDLGSIRDWALSLAKPPSPPQDKVAKLLLPQLRPIKEYMPCSPLAGISCDGGLVDSSSTDQRRSLYDITGSRKISSLGTCIAVIDCRSGNHCIRGSGGRGGGGSGSGCGAGTAATTLLGPSGHSAGANVAARRMAEQLRRQHEAAAAAAAAPAAPAKPERRHRAIVVDGGLAQDFGDPLAESLFGADVSLDPLVRQRGIYEAQLIKRTSNRSGDELFRRRPFSDASGADAWIGRASIRGQT
eukprot:NODE_9090_length_1447_cov_6.334848.p1 GENE.NODE_9090_length_1447_cov_6.334848~~NODE_9090_length_1447_cov_6.334848.p1  ORF type:complete len:281 (-),score=51.98 NODE_9090_length_1447_cov_6.334848:478-1320(-)